MSTLLSNIEAFLTTHKMAPTRFGDLAMGDRHLVRQLRDGRRLWPETEQKVANFIAQYGKDAPAETPAKAA